MSVIVPGSYDPVTNGHLDVIRRAAEENDEVYAVIFVNPEKEYKFSLDDRVRMLILATDDIPNVLVSYSNGLVIDYMRDHGIERIVKGYRNDVDLEYERRQAEYNLRFGGYETELKKCRDGYENISSTEVRKRLDSGENIDGLLPSSVAEYIKRIRE
jgi:pantetheine-phosphate adenylyltransferase